MNDTPTPDQQLWSRSNELLREGTEPALREALDILTSLLDMVPAADGRAAIHALIATGHDGLAKLDKLEHAIPAVEHALQACRNEVFALLRTGDAAALGYYFSVLAHTVTNPGVDLTQLKMVQSFIDSHHSVLKGVTTNVDLQQAVAEGCFMMLVHTSPVTTEMRDTSRRAFQRSLELMEKEPDLKRLAFTAINQSFAELLCAQTVTEFHRALDLALAAEDEHSEFLRDETQSVRESIIANLRASLHYRELARGDRWRLNFRLWENWAFDWVQRLEHASPGGVPRPPTMPESKSSPEGRWWGQLLQLDIDEFPVPAEAIDPDSIPEQVREHVDAMVAVGGYPLALVDFIAFSSLGKRVPLDQLFPELMDTGDDPRLRYGVFGHFARMRDLVTAGQRGVASAAHDLFVYYGSLPEDAAAPMASSFLQAHLDIARANTSAHQWYSVLHYMHRLALKVPEPDRLEVMDHVWRAIKPSACTIEHYGMATLWVREMVRLAKLGLDGDPNDTEPTYLLINALLQQASVRAVIEGDEITEVADDLGQRVAQYRALGGDEVKGLALECDLLRLRAVIANACGDHDAHLAYSTECLRIVLAHPELGRLYVAAVNFINTVEDASAATQRGLEGEIELAARDIFEKLPRVLEMGRSGQSAIAALTEAPLVGLTGLTSEEADLAADALRAQRADEHATTVSRSLGDFGPRERTLLETLQVCAHRHKLGHHRSALQYALEWLSANVDDPFTDHRNRQRNVLVALALEQHARTTEGIPELLRMGAQYVVGEAARHAGFDDMAEEHLSTAFERARSTLENPSVAEAFECDYAGLMITRAVQRHEQADALHWLHVLFNNPLALTPPGVIPRATAVKAIADGFGADVVADEAIKVLGELNDAAHINEDNPDTKLPYRAGILRAELMILTGETAELPEVLGVLDHLARNSPPTLEGYIRKTRVGAFVAIGDEAGIRAELDRLAFLQDEAVATISQFDRWSYTDHVGDAQLVAAAAAADAGDIAGMVEILEQGRLRLLRRLHLGIEEQHLLPDAPEAQPPADVWAYLLAECAEEPTGEFGVAVGDWSHVFSAVDSTQVNAVAGRAGIVGYQFVHGAVFRAVLIALGRYAVRVPPIGVREIELAAESGQEFQEYLTEGWAEALSVCLSNGFPADALAPILVTAGERPELAVVSDQAFGAAATRANVGGARVLNHLPSVRLANIANPAQHLVTQPIQVLHVGDASNTLLGPWMEAASLAQIAGVEVVSLLGPDSTEPLFKQHLPNVSMIVASCHGARGRGLLGSSLMVGESGLTITDIAASHTLAHVEMLFLASCSMGRRFGSYHERESVSLSNAALVSGCRHVVAPILPVNDLLSAVMVNEFCRRLPDMSSPRAFGEAVTTVHTMTVDELTDRVRSMWLLLSQSPIAATMPWPLAAASRSLERRITVSFARGVPLSTYCLSRRSAAMPRMREPAR